MTLQVEMRRPRSAIVCSAKPRRRSRNDSTVKIMHIRTVQHGHRVSIRGGHTLHVRIHHISCHTPILIISPYAVVAGCTHTKLFFTPPLCSWPFGVLPPLTSPLHTLPK